MKIVENLSAPAPRQLIDAPLAPVGEDRGLSFEQALEAETRAEGTPVPMLGQAILRLLRQCQLDGQPLRPTGTLAMPGEEERQRVRELALQVQGLDEAQRRRLPQLLHGLGLLEAAAGLLEAAQRSLVAAVGAAAAGAQAPILYNAARVALEQRDRTAALTLLLRAAALDAVHFAPYPLDKYEAERILGGELTGITLLCKERASGLRVAVKALWPDGLANSMPDVFREAKALSELEHPVLAQPREGDFVGEGPRRPYLVTEYFEGTTLAAQVAQHGPFASPTEVAGILRNVAELLHIAHERSIWHRDLKPASVLLRKESAGWRVNLINFGLAARPSILLAPLGGPGSWARSAIGTSSANTLPYLAPEQLGLTDGAVAGPAADVYGFGRLAYFALLGTPEPDDEQKEALLPAWRKFLGQCTARTVARRPASFALILKQLAQLQPNGAETIQAPASALTSPGGAPPEARTEGKQVLDYLNRGTAFRQQGNLERALAAFTKALQLDPKSAPAYLKRGNVFLERAEYDRAIADYTAALKLDPHNAGSYMNRGLAQAKKGNFDAVVADCGEAIRLDPKLATAYSIRAEAYWERGERLRAIADYSLALRIDPNNALAYNGRGLAFADEEDFDRAIDDFTQALRHDPRLVVAYINRGDAFRLKKDWDKAIADYNRALRLDTRSALAYYKRGLTFAAKQVYDQASADFTKVLQLEPRHTDAGLRREEALLAQSKLAPGPRAAPATGKMPAVNVPVPPKPVAPAAAKPAAPPAKPAVVPTVPASRPVKSATEQAEEERRQMRAAAHFSQGRSLMDEEKYEQAIEQFTRAIEVDAKDPVYYLHRGQAHVANDDFAKALADFGEALRLDPRNAPGYYQRGIAHRLLGQHDRAIDDYTQALKLDPRHALAYRNRSRAYAAKGEMEKAKADQERALRLDPHLAKDED